MAPSTPNNARSASGKTYGQHEPLELDQQHARGATPASANASFHGIARAVGADARRSRQYEHPTDSCGEREAERQNRERQGRRARFHHERRERAEQQQQVRRCNECHRQRETLVALKARCRDEHDAARGRSREQQRRRSRREPVRSERDGSCAGADQCGGHAHAPQERRADVDPAAGHDGIQAGGREVVTQRHQRDERASIARSAPSTTRARAAGWLPRTPAPMPRRRPCCARSSMARSAFCLPRWQTQARVGPSAEAPARSTTEAIIVPALERAAGVGAAQRAARTSAENSGMAA